MSNELTTLSTLAVEINLLNEQVENHKNQAVIYAARTGEKLLLAKAQCKHGEFGNWLKENCTVSPSYASNFMKLAKDMPQLLNSHSSVNLGLKQAIELLSAPEEIREEVTAKIESGEDVTVKEIQRLKKETAEAKEKLEQSNKQKMQLTQKIDSKQEEIAILTSEKWKLENQQTQIIEAKVASALEIAKIQNLDEIRKAEQAANIAQNELERLKKEQAKAIENGVKRELYNLENEIAGKQAQIKSYSRDIEKLREVENSLERKVGYLQTHKKAIERIKDNLSFLTVSFSAAFDTNTIPDEVHTEWQSISYALSQLNKQMLEFISDKSPLESVALVGELV